MKNNNKFRFVSFVVIMIFVIASFPTVSNAIDLWDMPSLGESSETQLTDGVTFTQFDLTGGKFGLQRVNVIEVDMKNRNLSLEVMTGQYITSKKTVQNFVSAYNQENNSKGKNMIAAVNGALWMTGTNCVVGEVATKIVTLPRGVVMHEGEILCSNETDQEASVGGGGQFMAFAVTDDYVPLIGTPIVTVKLKNNSKNQSVWADGFNRLPSNNALMIYNGKMGVSNYALSDAYEVVVTYESGRYVDGGVIKGTVRAIAKGGESAIDDNTIILSARGDRVSWLKDYAVGDKIEIDLDIYDSFRPDNDWTRVKESIPGHLLTIYDGEMNEIPDNSYYPCTMVGYKNDGTVVFIQNDGRQSNGWSQGLKIANMPEFCKLLDLNTVINLDGGGSSTMVVGGNVVNRPSDGSSRAVINGIGIVVGPQRCEQGYMPIVVHTPFDPINVRFDNKSMASRIGNTMANDASASYSADENAAKLHVDNNTNDAYLSFNYSGAYSLPSADTYKALVFKYKTSPSLNNKMFEVFLCAGSITGPTGGYSQAFTMIGDNQWHYGIIDCSGYSWWNGNIHMLRLDFIAGDSNQNDTVYLGSIQLAKTVENANYIAAGLMEGEQSMEPPAQQSGLKPVSTWTFDNDKLKITGVPDSIMAETVVSLFKMNAQNVKVKTVNNGIYAGTGTTVQYKDSVYSIIVKGDVDGNAKVTVTDYIMIKRHFLRTYNLSGAFYDAADTDGNGAVDITDYLSVKNHLKKINTLF